jgi:hypothetical protein
MILNYALNKDNNISQNQAAADKSPILTIYDEHLIYYFPKYIRVLPRKAPIEIKLQNTKKSYIQQTIPLTTSLTYIVQIMPLQIYSDYINESTLFCVTNSIDL